MNYSSYEDYSAARGLRAPPGLSTVLSNGIADHLKRLLYRPDRSPDQETSLEWARGLLNDACQPAPENLLPLLPVDDCSLACAVCASQDEHPDTNESPVIRWHLDDIDPRHQGHLLDTDPSAYLESVAQELADQRKDLAYVRKVARRYKENFTSKGVRPPAWTERPVQLACQNVIIGLGTILHDQTFDGLRVPAYLTCEVPHLATHEGNRAMTALLLCDAFQNGGTMEIRFGCRNSERPVPPALRRFGRSLGVTLGTEDPLAISPSEARHLFISVTPMPNDLKWRVLDIIDRGLISPERICFTLLASVWNAIELDYIISASNRVRSILSGGALPEHRADKLAELEVCRAAVMVGMYFKRLNNAEYYGRRHNSVNVLEDATRGIEWHVMEDTGIVSFEDVNPGSLPWSTRQDQPLEPHQSLIVIPRGLPTPHDFESVVQKQKEVGDSSFVTLMVPADMQEIVPSTIPLLRCPDRMSNLDHHIERQLQKLRIGRE